MTWRRPLRASPCRALPYGHACMLLCSTTMHTQCTARMLPRQTSSGAAGSSSPGVGLHGRRKPTGCRPQPCAKLGRTRALHTMPTASPQGLGRRHSAARGTVLRFGVGPRVATPRCCRKHNAEGCVCTHTRKKPTPCGQAGAAGSPACQPHDPPPPSIAQPAAVAAAFTTRPPPPPPPRGTAKRKRKTENRHLALLPPRLPNS